MQRAFAITSKKNRIETDTLLATNKDDWPYAKTTVHLEKKKNDSLRLRGSSSSHFILHCRLPETSHSMRYSRTDSGGSAQTALSNVSSIAKPARRKNISCNSPKWILLYCTHPSSVLWNDLTDETITFQQQAEQLLAHHSLFSTAN